MRASSNLGAENTEFNRLSARDCIFAIRINHLLGSRASLHYSVSGLIGLKNLVRNQNVDHSKNTKR